MPDPRRTARVRRAQCDSGFRDELPIRVSSPTLSSSPVSMNLYLAPMTRDTADAFDLGDDPHDDGGFDAAMALFSNEGGLEVEKAWCAVGAIVGVDLPDLEPFWVGEPITEDLGYGPAFHASPTAVQRIAATLSVLTETEARRRLDAAIKAGAVDYPAIWDREDEAESNRRWAVETTMQVVALYERAAVHGLGMLAMLL
jgi:Domain of unknown function (DUF1877)